MTILTKSPRRVKPAGFYDTPAPQPAPDLRLFLDDDRRIIKLHVKGENAYRWHREVMTLDHPFMVKFLAGYVFIQEYRVAHIGLTVRAYRLSELPPTPVGKNAHDDDIVDRFVSETAPNSPTPVSELDGPRNWGESIMELLGQDYRAAREHPTRPAVPTAEQGERMLRAALGADWNQRHADRRAQFGRGR